MDNTKFFVGNRKSLAYKALIRTIIGIMVIGGFLMAGKAYADKDVFFKLAVAKDIGMIIETLIALPGDAHIEYPTNMKGYGIIVSNEEVKVFSSKAGLLDPASARYGLSSAEGMDLKTEESGTAKEIRNAKRIFIIKSGNRIVVKSGN